MCKFLGIHVVSANMLNCFASRLDEQRLTK